ncbi:MAG: ATP synthase F1 subunit delta [Nitrospirae bacterium]|nr:ATP synthase F1 subunit delta [Nitrospirota bacterium]
MRKSSKAAKRYAQTLYNSLSIEELEKVINELTLVNKLIKKDKCLRSVFSSPMFFDKDRMDAIEQITKELNLTRLCKSFVLNVIKKKDVDQISDILTVLMRFYLSAKNMAIAVVTTSALLDKEKHERLKDSLKSRLNKEVEIEYVIDPAIIGGFVVKVEGYVFDVSLKGQLAKLREALLER